MHYYIVAIAGVIRSDQSSFTYQSEVESPIGQLVRVPIGKKIMTGIIISAVPKPAFPTKAISQVLPIKPLPSQLIKTAEWISLYYATHLGHVLSTMLPAGLHKKRRANTKTISHPIRERTHIVLNEEQAAALSTIERISTGAVLMHGVTGSGKTQLYIQAAVQASQKGQSTLVLVPEIALTPQLIAEFNNYFKTVVVAHSGLTEAARHQAWLQVTNSDEPIIVVGARSALFMPIKNLGLIVVDECHEPSYKQEQQPKYSALRVASMLARFHRCKVIFGSATPSVADYFLATSTNQHVIKLTKPAIPSDPPKISLIDNKKRDNFKEHRFLSDRLIADMREALANGGQSLIFHNRRGTAPTTLCEKCGWSALCAKCQLPLTLHADHFKLLCHSCGEKQTIPTVCPSCQHANIMFKGIGTKLIESEIIKLFPKATVARFDADNSSEEKLQARYQQLYDGEVDIIIGTQLLAKGLDLPGLQVVGVIQADSGLQLPDYQSAERVFQLLFQVAGRVGRGHRKSNVVIQTYQPDHEIIGFALKRDYRQFYDWQITERRQAQLPPFAYLLKLTCAYKTEKGAIEAAQKMFAAIKKSHPGVTVVGPMPSFYERLNNTYRWQLLIKSSKRNSLIEIAKNASPPWQVDIDPVSIL